MKKNSIAILLLVVLAIGCDGGDGENVDLISKLTAKTYKIANQTELATQLSALTPNGALPQYVSASGTGETAQPPALSASASSIGKTTNTTLPDTIVFSTDGKFKLTYSSGAYLPGTWKITGGILEMTAASRISLIDVSFPDDSSISIKISSSTPSSSSSLGPDPSEEPIQRPIPSTNPGPSTAEPGVPLQDLPSR